MPRRCFKTGKVHKIFNWKYFIPIGILIIVNNNRVISKYVNILCRFTYPLCRNLMKLSFRNAKIGCMWKEVSWLTDKSINWVTSLSTIVLQHPVVAQLVKSKSHYDRRPVGQCALVSSPVWGSWSDVNYCLTVTLLSISGAPSDERWGLSFVLVTWTASVQYSKFAAGPRQHSISPYL
jgi:hypothetical protein